MNHQEIFETWKRHRQQAEVGRDFVSRVMTRIQEGQAARPAVDRSWLALARRWAARPWARAALFVLGLALGLARILMMVQLILLG